MQITTPDFYTYETINYRLEDGVSSLLFKAKACNNVHLGMLNFNGHSVLGFVFKSWFLLFTSNTHPHVFQKIYALHSLIYINNKNEIEIKL